MTLTANQKLALDIDSKATAIAADVDSWDFLNAAGRAAVSQLCATDLVATATDMASPATADLYEVLSQRLSDLNLLKSTVQAQIEEARSCSWLKAALSETPNPATKLAVGNPAGCGAMLN